MSLDDLARELREAAEKATPGSWAATYAPRIALFEDARFISLASPENIKALLDERAELLGTVRAMDDMDIALAFQVKANAWAKRWGKPEDDS